MRTPSAYRYPLSPLVLLLAGSAAAVGAKAPSSSSAMSSAEAEALLVLAGESLAPLCADELRALGRTDDVLALRLLVPALRRRVEQRGALGPIAPAELDREIIEALHGIERLDPVEAERWAREVLANVPPECPAGMAARETLARGGDADAVREALERYFEAPERWGRLLGQAARALTDPRLDDFLELGGEPPEPATLRLTESRLETSLARSRDEWKLADILFWAEEHRTLTAARIVSSIPEGSVHEGWVRHLLFTLASPPRGGSAEEPGRRAARLRAINALAQRGATEAARVLRSALGDEDREVAAAAAFALAQLGDNQALGRLRPLAMSLEEPLGAAAIEALVQLGGEEEALALARERKDWSLRTAWPVVRSLGAKGRERAAALAHLLNGVASSRDRLRLLRAMAEEDTALLKRIPMGAEEVAALSPYLARSRDAELRRRVLEVEGPGRSRALAALVLSPTATGVEKQEAAKALDGQWAEPLCAGGPALVGALDQLSASSTSADRVDVATPLEALPDAEASCVGRVLMPVPGAKAREALERMARAGTVELLMRRPDRALALPTLLRWSRSEDQALRQAAEMALVALGAPGSRVIRKQWVGPPENRRRMMPLLVETPMAGGVLAVEAKAAERRPWVQAALFAFHRARPKEFLPLLSLSEPEARRRIHSALALSGAHEALPLLADIAVNDRDKLSRLAALRGLAVVKLGRFRGWLHRAAGDPDRDIRLAAALASIPTGELWALRLALAEMDPARPEHRRLLRQALGRLGEEKARELLAQVFRDGTGNLFSTYLYVGETGEALGKDDEKRAWELVSDQLDRSPEALLVASRLERREAARAVLARLH